MISRRRAIVWAMVVAALWTGCAVGRLGSYPAASPVRTPVDCEGLDFFPAEGRAEALAPAARLSLTDSEIEALWGELAVEYPGLADQSAGIEGRSYGGVCTRCGVWKPDGHTHRGEGGGGGGGGLSPGDKKLLAAYAATLAFVFLFVDYMADKSAP